MAHFRKTSGTKCIRLFIIQALSCGRAGTVKLLRIQEANMMTHLIIQARMRATNKSPNNCYGELPKVRLWKGFISCFLVTFHLYNCIVFNVWLKNKHFSLPNRVITAANTTVGTVFVDHLDWYRARFWIFTISNIFWKLAKFTLNSNGNQTEASGNQLHAIVLDRITPFSQKHP